MSYKQASIPICTRWSTRFDKLPPSRTNFTHEDIMMDLKAAQELMKPDNSKWFKTAYENLNKAPDSSLTEYIEEICADPEEWVRKLPAHIRAPSTLNKPKTAVVSLVGLETDLEADLKSDLKTKLEKTYRNKAFIESILRDRAPDGKSENGDCSKDETLEMRCQIEKLQGQVDVLKRALAACCKNTEFAETVVILTESM